MGMEWETFLYVCPSCDHFEVNARDNLFQHLRLLATASLKYNGQCGSRMGFVASLPFLMAHTDFKCVYAQQHTPVTQ